MPTSRLWDGGYWTKQSISGIGPQKRLRDCNIEEVRAQFHRRPNEAMAFHANGNEKLLARRKVLEAFSLEHYPDPIRVLSMPGLEWRFETALLKQRDNVINFRSGPKPCFTEIHAVENDRAIYYQSVMRVPSINHHENVIVDLGPTAYAERMLSYHFINRFIFANVDDMMAHTSILYDCVWLDYFGPINPIRLALIQRFFENNVRGTLVLTNLKNRWTPEISMQLDAHDGYEAFIKAAFPSARIDHYIEYFDTCYMTQLAISKV